jgi:folate-binding protein YgfZ
MAIGEALSSHVSGGVAEQLPDEWREVLEQGGARFDGAGVADYGQPEAERRQALSVDVMADLSHYGLIEAKGEDARKFLAGQFTGDVRLVSPERGLFTAWCDAKGRAQATFWLFMHGDAFYVLLPREILEPVMAGLKRYLLRVKATLADAGDQLARLGLSGPGLESRLAVLLGAPPPLEIGETRTCGGYTLLAVAGATYPRWLVLGEPVAVAGLWRDLSPAVPPVGRDTWTLLDILAGIPLLVTETAGEFIPQMLNLEALGGICYTKGCYPGQEVIARLHYRGQLKRRLYRATLDSGRIPAPGSKLYGEGLAESVGTVVSAARHPDGRVALLAVVKIEEKGLGPVRLEDAQGPELAFVE